MPPGPRSFKLGMCLQRSYFYNETLGFHTVEKIDKNTRFLVGDENFRKISIEDRKYTILKTFINQ